MGSKTCSVNSSSGNWLTANVSWDSNLEVTCTVSSDNPWRLKTRGSSGDSGVIYSVDYETSSHEFSFDAVDGGEYIFQVVNDPGYEYANNDFATSGFTVTSGDDSGGGGDDSGGDDSGGGGSSDTYIIYINEGIGTRLEVIRTWNETTGEENWDDEIPSGTEIVYDDYFMIFVSAMEGYENLEVNFGNFTVKDEGVEASGTIYYKGKMEYPGDIVISSSATSIATAHIYNKSTSSWNRYAPYIYNGASWNRYAPYIYNGTSWNRYV